MLSINCDVTFIYGLQKRFDFGTAVFLATAYGWKQAAS